MEAAATHSLAGTHTGANRWLLPFLPSLTDFAFILPALLLFVLLPGSSLLLSDGDTGWHIRTGEWIWQHKAVPTTDIFSFTKPHEAWFAWEWGWDLLFAGIHHFCGLGGVAFASVVILCAVSVLLFRLIRRYTDHDFLAFAFAAFAMFGSVIHWLARPHLVSWLFVLIFAHAILSAERGTTKTLVWLPALMLLWVNLHGAFFIGILMLLTSAAGEVLTALFSDEPFWKAAWIRAKPYGICAAVCSAVTFINPYTWRLHWHIAHCVRDFQLLDRISEFQSISFHQAISLPFECMLLLGIGTAFWCLGRRQFGAALSVVLWAHWGLLAARNIPFFLFFSTPVTACMVKDVLARTGDARRIRRIGSAIMNFGRESQSFERLPRCYLTSLATLILVATGFVLGVSKFEAQFNPKNFPTTALSCIKSAKFARLFTTDQWADYLVYHLYPAQPTFTDGRSDFFGADFLEHYGHVVNAQHEWEADLQAYGVDGVLLRPNSPVVSALKESRNWKLLFDDGSAVIFRKVSIMPLRQSIVKPSQISLVERNGRKSLGLLGSSALHNSNTESQERRS